jgi:hypothetical protein
MVDFRPVFADRYTARALHYARAMRSRAARATLSFAIALSLFGAPASARGEGAGEASLPDPTAVREFLHGETGRREAWHEVPTLVVLTSVMHYTGTSDMSSGYISTGEELTDAELQQLTADLTRALDSMTGGRVTAFPAIERQSVPAGQTVRVLRRNRIVVGRLSRRAGCRGNPRLRRTHELGHAIGYNHVDSRVSVTRT